MRTKKLFVALSVAGVVISGCATSPDKIAAQSVSTVPYEQYNCQQIGAEAERVNRRASDLHGSLQKTASNDNAQMAIGMVLFWPALFFLEGGDGPEAAEYGRLKGEKEALERVAIQKQCGMVAANPVEQKATTQPVAEQKASPETPTSSNVSQAAQQ